MKYIKDYWMYILIICLSFFAIKPLLQSGFFSMHDDTQVARVFEMSTALRDKEFPVRWVADLGYGYGYPLFNFYAPLAYYLGGIINVVGVDALVATKLMMIIGIVLSGLSMYLLAKEFWGRAGGLIAGLLYLYAPYHAVDIYVRGDVAEFFAYAWIPLTFYGVWKIYQQPRWKWVIVSSLSYAAIVLSHNLTAMMVTPFLLCVLAYLVVLTWNSKTKRTKYLLLSSFFLGLLVSAFYWLPVLFEMQYTNVISQVSGGADFTSNFVCLSQLWDSPWGYGGSVPGCIDGLSFRIGKLHIILTILAIGSAWLLYKKERKLLSVWLFAMIGLLVSVLLTLEFSAPVWDLIKPMAFFQYPWRFLLMISFFSSFLGGSVIWTLEKFLTKFHYRTHVIGIACIILLLATFVLYAKLFTPQQIIQKTAADYTSSFSIRYGASRLTDEYMPKGFIKPKTPFDLFSRKFAMQRGKGRVLLVNGKTQEYRIAVKANIDTIIHINIAPFPAWHFTLDNKKVTPLETNTGYDMNLPNGSHVIVAQFEQTLVENIGNVISLASIAGLIIGIILERKKSLHEKTT